MRFSRPGRDHVTLGFFGGLQHLVLLGGQVKLNRIESVARPRGGGRRLVMYVRARLAVQSRSVMDTPFESVCKAWTKEANRFKYDPVQLTSGLHA